MDVVHVGGHIDVGRAPLLPGLGPLAGDQQHRGGAAAAQDGLPDGLAPVVFDDAGAFHIPGDLPGDALRLLLPRVLLREDDQVGVFAGHLPQCLPPVEGLLARAAEHGHHPPPGVLLLHGAEQGLEAHAVVGVVHDGHHCVVGVGVHLHPPGHPGPEQSGVNGVLRDVEGQTDGDGRQGVFHVEQPRHGQPEGAVQPLRPHMEQDVPPLFPHLVGVDLGGGVPLGEGDDGPARGPGRFQHPVGVVAVQVDAVHRPLPEDAQLGGEVVLEVRVLDGGDVILPDVQKAGGGEVGAQGTVVLQGLAGHLHGQVVDAAGGGVGEVPLEVHRVGGGDVGLEPLYPVIGVDGGDHGGLRPAQALLQPVQNVLEIVGGGGFALGARDADDLQLPRGVVIEQVGQGGDGRAHVIHRDAGKVHLRIGGGAHIGDGPPVLGRLQKLPLEVGPLADEQGAGDDLPGVVGHQLHRRGAVGHGGGVFRQQPPAGQQVDVVLKGVAGQFHSAPRVVS